MRLVLPVLGFALVALFAYSYSNAAPSVPVPGRDSTAPGVKVAPPPLAVRSPQAMVRFVNAMPGSAALELGQDSLMIFSNVIFGAVSPFKAVSSAKFRFTLRTQASTGYDATSVTTLAANQHYSIVALPDKAGKLSVHVIRDDLAPDSGLARIRLIRATPGLGNVSFWIVGQDVPLFRAEADSSEAQYHDMKPMTAGFRVRGGAGDETLVSLKSMALSPGSTYTFVLTARPGSPVTAINFSDMAEPASKPAVAAQP